MELQPFFAGEHPTVCRDSHGRYRADLPRPKALLPGSFHPLHDGHLQLARVAALHLGSHVDFELSIQNVDKPNLTIEDVERRTVNFPEETSLWLTWAATFEQKAALFPGCTFVVGYDTAVRMLDLKYYAGQSELRDRAFCTLIERGCRVLVGGRIDETGAFRVWEGNENLFTALTEAEFRLDISSTALRQQCS